MKRKKILISLTLLGISLFIFSLLERGNGDEFLQEPESEGEMATHAADYFNFRRKSRMDENGNIPMDGLVKAKRHIAQMQSRTRDAGLWEWDWLGPSNIGGRIRTILPDPNDTNVIWIGSVSGGIWKTVDGGATWTNIDDFMKSLAVTSLVFDPSSTAIMYASTGEGFTNNDALPGAGIFKSVDSGQTWVQLASTNNNDFKYVNRLAAHPDPDSAGVLYAVTKPGGIYKTTDGGITWDKKFVPQTTAADIDVDYVNPEKVIVGCFGDVYLSTDYGETWTEQTTGAANKLPSNTGRCEVSFCKSYSRIYVAMQRNGGEIWRSDNDGTVWTLRSTGTNYMGTQGWYANALWVSPTNSNLIVVGGLDLWRSTNGGQTLTQISDWRGYHNGGSANSAHADQHAIVSAVNYSNNANPVVYFGNDGGIQKTFDVWNVTKNSGWINLANTSLGITQFYGGAASDDGSIIVGGAQDNDKLRYKKTGSWSGKNNWYQSETGDGGYAAINYNDNNIIYGSYKFLAIKKSTDGGNTYQNAFTGIADQGNRFRALFIAPFSMDPNDPNILVAGGSRIYRTTTAAANWTEIRDTIGSFVDGNGNTQYYKCSAIDIDDGNSSLIWVGYENGHVAYTNDAGTTWVRVDTNGVNLPDRYVTDIAIDPGNSNRVFVTFGGFNGDNVWYTPDGGSTWINRSGTPPNDLPELPVNTVRIHPAHGSWVYIGTDLGVFATADRGVNWSVKTNTNAANGNEGPVNTEVSELFWQGDEFLIAATHGRGMFRTGGPVYKIYVDAAAAPGGDGSQARPFRTVAEAAGVAGPGSYIYIQSGDYDENQIITFQNEGFVIAVSGNVTIR